VHGHGPLVLSYHDRSSGYPSEKRQRGGKPTMDTAMTEAIDALGAELCTIDVLAIGGDDLC
jgi:hypothetical protein